MKLGNTDRGTGIVCENKVELVLVVSALGDILDREFWREIEEDCIQMTIGRKPVYITHLFDEAKDKATSSFAVEILGDKSAPVRTHKNPRYIVYTFDSDPREVINRVIFSASEIAKKKPYKI